VRLSTNGGDGASLWNGTAWQGFTGLPVQLDGLACVAADDAYLAAFFAVSLSTFQTEVLHWDGSQWTMVATLPGVARAVSAASASDVYAVGDDGWVAHYDGARWMVVPRPTALDLEAVSAIGAGGAIAVGSAGKVVATDGSNWRTEREASPDGNGYISGVWGDSTSPILLSANGVFRLDGGGLSETVLPEGSGVAAFAGWSIDDVFAAGEGPAIFHYDGNAWSISADSLAGYQRDMCAVSPGTVFAVGDRSAYRFDGVWTRIYDGERYLEMASGCGAGGIVAIARASDFISPMFVTMYDGSTWSDLPISSGWFDGLWSDSPSNIWLAGAQGLLHWDGTHLENVTPGRRGFESVFGLSGSRVLAFYQEGSAYFDGTLWNFSSARGPHRAVQIRNDSILGAFFHAVGVWEPGS
jgi:hypothetical protein